MAKTWEELELELTWMLVMEVSKDAAYNAAFAEYARATLREARDGEGRRDVQVQLVQVPSWG